MIKYVYPKFDGLDLLFFRIGGSGLGNLLFPFFRALVYAKNHNLKIISPTFRSLKLGPYLRNEYQKRSYNYKYNKSIRGLHRIFLLVFFPKADEKKLERKILIFKSFGDGFKSLYGFEDYLKEQLSSLLDTKINHQDYKDTICCHIRLGDFKSSDKNVINNNTRISISWYIQVINKLREKELLKVLIFSDGKKNELSDILKLENCYLESSNEPIIDILKLSSSKYFIGSFSSFSMWASFFSSGDCIWHEQAYNKNDFPLNSNNYILKNRKLLKV